MTTTRILPTAKIVKRSTATFLKQRPEKEKQHHLSSSFDYSNPLTMLFNELSFSNQKRTSGLKQRSLHHNIKSRKRSFCLCSLDEIKAKRPEPSSPKSVMKTSPLDQVEDYGYFTDYDLNNAPTFPSSAELDMGF